MSEIRFLHGKGSPPDEHRLPRGQHDLTAEFVAGHQRGRILEATTHVLYEHGYAEATVAQIVRRAKVSRRTFYENFENKEHCYLATFGATLECMAAAIREQYRGATWGEKVAGAFAELMRLVIEHPEAAHTCLVEVGAAGQDGETRRADALRLCQDGVRTMVELEFEREDPVDPVALELAVGGLHGVMLERLRRRDSEAAAAVMPDAVRSMLLPLVGTQAADDVAERMMASAPAALVSRASRG